LVDAYVDVTDAGSATDALMLNAALAVLDSGSALDTCMALLLNAWGPRSGSSWSQAGSGATWYSPESVQASDTNYASVHMQQYQPPWYFSWSYFLIGTGFSFNIPSDAIINGILVEIQRKASYNYSPNRIGGLQLLKAGSPVGASLTGVDITTDEMYEAFGGPTYLWQTAWSVSDINNSGFGLQFLVNAYGYYVDDFVNHARITVYYTLGNHSFSVTETVALSAERALMTGTLGTVTDLGSAVDLLSLLGQTTVADVGSGGEVWGIPVCGWVVADSGKVAEFIWRLKGHVFIGEYEPPNVLRISIRDQVALQDKAVMSSLPRRSLLGRRGRIVQVDGWTDQNADIAIMRALQDGVTRTFIHPDGDSFAVRVSKFDPSRTVDEYDRRLYRLTFAEVR